MLVHIPKAVELILGDIVSRIKETVNITRIMLYGSYANGTYNPQSDLDIAVFIEDGTISTIDAYRYVKKICTMYDADIQPQIFYESEYKNPMGIVEEVVQYGIEITNFNILSRTLSRK